MDWIQRSLTFGSYLLLYSEGVAEKWKFCQTPTHPTLRFLSPFLAALAALYLPLGVVVVVSATLEFGHK